MDDDNDDDDDDAVQECLLSECLLSAYVCTWKMHLACMVLPAIGLWSAPQRAY
jgi:hypothetical protein